MVRPLSAVFSIALVSAACAQTLQPPYNTSYTIFDVGTVPGVPTPYGGLTLLAGDNDTLLIGGSANQGSGALYSIPVTRNECNNIIGFPSPGTFFSTCANHDGGLAYGPNGVLFATAYPTNLLHQIKPGSAAPDRSVDLTALGVSGSVGALTFVPAGFANEGHLKLISYSAGWFYDSILTPDGNGTFNVTSVVQHTQITGGPEGIFYVPTGSPLFPNPAILVCLWGQGRVDAWDVDAQGNPIAGTSRVFISGLSGVEGGYIDPISGDFMFSTYGGSNHIISVRGFARVCDSIDFNADGLFPDTADIDDFLSVFSGGACSNPPHCGDIDYNNDCLYPDTSDIDSLLSVFSGGPCI
ncbi:MAG: hypothetical protein U0637_14375 [Phycisphaerales bacterium]